jgi:hypothetical protein
MIWVFLPTWNVPLKVYLLPELRALRRVAEAGDVFVLSFRRQLVKNHAFCFQSGPPKSPLQVHLLLGRVALQMVSPERWMQRPTRENMPSSLGVLIVAGSRERCRPPGRR